MDSAATIPTVTGVAIKGAALGEECGERRVAKKYPRTVMPDAGALPIHYTMLVVSCCGNLIIANSSPPAPLLCRGCHAKLSRQMRAAGQLPNFGPGAVMIAALPCDTADLLARADMLGFDKCIYAVDFPDGVIDPPLLLTGSGLTETCRSEYLQRVPQDPLRRMVARGEIVVANTPIVWENDGSRLSLSPDRRLSSSDTSMLRWLLAQGMRTGLAFRIRMPQGRCASINFFSALGLAAADLEQAIQTLFLIGHRLHARLEPTFSEPRDTLLSRRESECLEWIARGLGNRQIAEALGLSIDTVKEHIQSLFIKLNATSRAHAVTRGHILAYLD